MNATICYDSAFRARAELWLAGIVRSVELLLCGASKLLYRDADGLMRTPSNPIGAREWRAAYEQIPERMDEEAR